MEELSSIHVAEGTNPPIPEALGPDRGGPILPSPTAWGPGWPGGSQNPAAQARTRSFRRSQQLPQDGPRSERSTLCHRCDATDPRHHHNASFLTDFHSQEESTWWQSQSMAFGIQHPNSVNITLHL
ncbi:PREDICTED: netrin-1, partial [Cariama cristata]|uniref:netrin-1 n=1 Tax=Cariama cristata TaxID=54380 RepID=UPI0005202CF7